MVEQLLEAKKKIKGEKIKISFFYLHILIEEAVKIIGYVIWNLLNIAVKIAYEVRLLRSFVCF